MKKKAIPTVSSINKKLIYKSVPLLVGSGLALGHLATTSSCTLAQQGRCSTCGSCVVALIGLVGWAMIKKNDDGDFYQKN